MEALIEIPFSFYNTFVIENNYGFNTTTKHLWLSDLLMTTALGPRDSVYTGLCGPCTDCREFRFRAQRLKQHYQ